MFSKVASAAISRSWTLIGSLFYMLERSESSPLLFYSIGYLANNY